MAQEFPDTSEETLLRTLERYYVKHAGWLFRANGIPEPARLPEPAPTESFASVVVPLQPTNSARSK
jgi:hypothetical protein